MRRIFQIAFLLCLVAAPVLAGDRPAAISPHDWLARPGVKLLAVEFYADWCKPCKQAIPRWQALKETYGPRGLKLVVVTVDSAQCTPPGLSADQAVCDQDAAISREWEATELPQAFLWAWPGRALVQHGTVEQVEKAVEDYYRTVPRIAVEEATAGEGKSLPQEAASELRDLVRGELSRGARFDIIADADERAMIRKWRKESAKANYDENTRCKVGMEVAPNSVLRITLGGEGKGRTLRLDLFSLESSCVTAWVQVPAPGNDLAGPAADAVAALVTRLVGRTQANASHLARDTVVDQDFSAAPSDWVPETGGIVIVQFASQPAGASVLLDGQVVCQNSSANCRKNIAAGTHRVAMHLEGHEAAARDVTFERNGILTWTLSPNTGTLSIDSTPSGVPVTIDGAPVGSTPVTRQVLPPGVYLVETTGQCHLPVRQRIQLERGQNRTLALRPSPVAAALKLVAEDAGGNALAARVLVDGVTVGKTPGTFTVSACARELRVVGEDGTTFQQELTLKANQTHEMAVVLGAEGGVAKRIRPGLVRVEPGCLPDSDGHEVCTDMPFYIGATEVTQAQWQAAFESRPSHFKQCGDDCPVERVSFWSALAYCNARSRLEGLPECYTLTGCKRSPGNGYRCDAAAFAGARCQGYRLPSDLEWELAARAGCGDEFCGERSLGARCKDNAGSRTGLTAALAANAFGIFDAVGNVWEWVWTPQGTNAIPSNDLPGQATESGLRVLRGGAFTARSSQCNLSARRHEPPGYVDYDAGFRVVRSIPEVP